MSGAEVREVAGAVLATSLLLEQLADRQNSPVLANLAKGLRDDAHRLLKGFPATEDPTVPG